MVKLEEKMMQPYATDTKQIDLFMGEIIFKKSKKQKNKGGKGKPEMLRRN